VNEELDIEFMAERHKVQRGYFVSLVVWRILLGLVSVLQRKYYIFE
jgi:hypothetical protein